MIHAKELRIGNVIWDGNKIRYVTHRIISDIASRPQDHGFYAIPLTPEWLERCGFELISFDFGISNFYKKNNRFELITVRDGIICEYEAGKFYYGDEKCNVLYVHQLMNLFYALTGEELTIKEA